MKFILGYIKNSKSVFHKGPKVIFHIRADHNGKRYEFERLKKNDQGISLPELQVYDTKDYPEDMLNVLFETNQLVELIAEPKAKVDSLSQGK